MFDDNEITEENVLDVDNGMESSMDDSDECSNDIDIGDECSDTVDMDSSDDSTVVPFNILSQCSGYRIVNLSNILMALQQKAMYKTCQEVTLNVLYYEMTVRNSKRQCGGIEQGRTLSQQGRMAPE